MNLAAHRGGGFQRASSGRYRIETDRSNPYIERDDES